MKAIIFDCDGTLVDSEVLANEVLVEAVAEYGLLISLAEATASFRGVKMADCVSAIERRLGHALPAGFIPEFRSRMAAVFQDRLRAMDGALELVSSIRQPFCVASSGPREKIELSLSLTGLLAFFKDAIFSSYEVGSWKPEPGLFLHAAQSMGFEPRDCAVVEDSLPGIRAGIAAGMEVFAFQPHGVDPQIPEEVHIIRHLSELQRWFLERSARHDVATDGPGPRR